MPPAQAGETSASAEDGVNSDSDTESAHGFRFLAPTHEEAKTLAQIKRSRVDLLRRFVFLCPMSLSRQYGALPQQARDSALLVFRCSRESVFKKAASGRSAGAASKVDTGMHRPAPVNIGGLASSSSQASLTALYRSEYPTEFLKWVHTKEKEGCVFWLRPDCDLPKLSRFFEEKIDPVSERPYKPLLLDPQWWRVKFQRASARYVGKPSAVIAAITPRDPETGNLTSRSQDIDLPAMQELIYQSNPSLEPIAKWTHAPSMRFLPREARSKAGVEMEQEKGKGYIRLDAPRSPGGFVDRESRIGRWPEKARDRFDNLHVLWHVEESSYERRQCFAMHGLSMVAPAGGPCSAR
mmetsp:Transcript_50528/g.145666  ORF Transcript_50528/g.145666 Transcript_50528/m.145666 type:complete len:352 (+) Transcript_50528:53-1108(+)